MEEKIKVLLIDDDEFIRLLVKDIFWVHGKDKYQFFEAKNIEEAKKILNEEKPNIIFLDLVFQEGGKGAMSSLSFLREIKSEPNTQNIKVIVFSGYPDLKKQVLELGAEKFLIKGEYLPKELFEITEEIIKK